LIIECNPFEQLEIMKSKPIRLAHQITSDVVGVGDLSSGETSIVRFLLLIYSASKEFFCPKLILLDEPDAHLHPSLINSFLKLLEGLIARHACRVIMSTHRVETIGFAPEGSVYVMHRDAPRVRCCDDKLKTIGMLTGNLYGLVLAGKRPVFVEDDDDATFYTTALKSLQRDGRWVAHIAPEYVSIARWASVGRRPGGKEGVEQAVKVMVGAGLEGHITGLVDRDDDGGAVPPMYELERYAIENYLLDPIVIYALLLDRRAAPQVRERGRGLV
jgi:AAA domain, putative AbiEii toxin, Type IV TA system